MKNSEVFCILAGIDLVMFAHVLFQDVVMMESLFYLTMIFLALFVCAVVCFAIENEL